MSKSPEEVFTSFDDMLDIYRNGHKYDGKTYHGIEALEKYYAANTRSHSDPEGSALTPKELKSAIQYNIRNNWSGESLMLALGGYLGLSNSKTPPDTQTALSYLQQDTGLSYADIKEKLESPNTTLNTLTLDARWSTPVSAIIQVLEDIIREHIPRSRAGAETTAPAPSPRPAPVLTTTSSRPPVDTSNTSLSYEDGTLILTRKQIRDGKKLPEETLINTQASSAPEAIQKLMEAISASSGNIRAFDINIHSLMGAGFTLSDLIASNTGFTLQAETVTDRHARQPTTTTTLKCTLPPELSYSPPLQDSVPIVDALAFNTPTPQQLAEAFVNGDNARIGFTGWEDFTQKTHMTAKKLESCGIPVDNLILTRKASIPTAPHTTPPPPSLTPVVTDDSAPSVPSAPAAETPGILLEKAPAPLGREAALEILKAAMAALSQSQPDIASQLEVVATQIQDGTLGADPKQTQL